MSDVHATILDIITRDRQGHPDSGEIRFQCPAHDDQHPSARYHPKRHVWYCDACQEGGGHIDLAQRLGISLNGHTKAKIRRQDQKVTTTHDYSDESGKFLYQICRLEPGLKKAKDYKPRHRTSSGRWKWGYGEQTPVLYNLPAVKKANAEGKLIFLPEGEKDADSVIKLGLVATTQPGGAGKWQPEYTEVLRGARVIMLPDNDHAGRTGAKKIIQALYGKVDELRVLYMPEPHKDVTDWLVAGGTLEALKELVRLTPLAEPPADLFTEPPADPTSEIQNTDLGNARRLVIRHGQDMRFNHVWGKWLIWDGHRWDLDDTGEAERRAKNTVQALHAEAKMLEDEDYKAFEEMTKFAKRSESRRAIHDMLSLARSEEAIPVTTETLDNHRYLLNTNNGTLDLTTGQLGPHKREHYLTKAIPITYDPSATCPTWDAFLQVIMNSNQTLIDFLQRWVGYCLTGDVSEQTLLFLYGTGANGKSTFLNVIHQLMGPYAVQAAPDLLMAKRNDNHPTELADLFGRRLAICNEIEAGRSMAEVTVKQLTGGDVVAARRMREDFWTFRPTHKIVLAGNHKPIVRGSDEGIWRRIRMIPFAVFIPEKDRDKKLPQYLEAELPGILTWAVQGCLNWLDQGLNEPDEVKAATDNYQTEMDTLGAFIDEACYVGMNATATVKQMYEAYATWCEESGHRPLGKTNFNTQLEERGQEKWKKDRGNFGKHTWYGIGLNKNSV